MAKLLILILQLSLNLIDMPDHNTVLNIKYMLYCVLVARTVLRLGFVVLQTDSQKMDTMKF